MIPRLKMNLNIIKKAYKSEIFDNDIIYTLQKAFTSVKFIRDFPNNKRKSNKITSQ